MAVTRLGLLFIRYAPVFPLTFLTNPQVDLMRVVRADPGKLAPLAAAGSFTSIVAAVSLAGR
jgi:hypothetical protein